MLNYTLLHRPCRPLLAALSALLLLLGHTVHAEETEPSEIFQIEYIAFAHQENPEQVNFELTKFAPNKKGPLNYVISGFEPLSESQHIKLPDEAMQLYDALRAIKRNKAYQLLSYGSWQQPIPPNTSLPPFLLDHTINKGEKNQAYFETSFEGTLTFKRSRYLHVKTDLYLSHKQYFPLENMITWVMNPSQNTMPKFQWMLMPYTADELVLMRDKVSVLRSNIRHMNQSRRLKYGEVHYIDHPAFGLIVLINKLEPTEDDYQ